MSFVDYSGCTKQEALGSVDTGWTSLVTKLWDDLHEVDPNVKVIQVKEKFGLLRVYIVASTDDPATNDKLDELCEEAELASQHVCEKCGSVDDVYTGSDNQWWLKTLCEQCHVARKALK